MKALILNSGIGERMGDLTRDLPKCMMALCTGQTILGRQIAQLEREGIREIVITTGPFSGKLEQHARDTAGMAALSFVRNTEYSSTNYIYSIYLAKDLLQDDIVLLHGDLVFSGDVLRGLLRQGNSAMAVSSTLPLPQKDFKAVIMDDRITAVGVEFFEDALAAQPLYKLNQADWMVWLAEIRSFIYRGETSCYAENALNAVSDRCIIYPFDVKDRLCAEIDTPEDLLTVDAILG